MRPDAFCYINKFIKIFKENLQKIDLYLMGTQVQIRLHVHMLPPVEGAESVKPPGTQLQVQMAAAGTGEPQGRDQREMDRSPDPDPHCFSIRGDRHSADLPGQLPGERQNPGPSSGRWAPC